MDGTTVRNSGHSPGDAPPSARGSWVELFSGRYQIVDWYDRDGRRYVVARRATHGERACLTSRQERTLALRASGQALKVIALELGVSLSTASRDLEAALKLLGLTSEAELAAILGDSTARSSLSVTVADV